jgi:acyl-CoA reductase-like NAD-dependent aldehyde dehydrogenase
VFAAATLAQKGWAKTPLWKRAEMIHMAAKLLQVRRVAVIHAHIGRRIPQLW